MYPDECKWQCYCRHVSTSYSRVNNHFVLYEWNNARIKYFQKCALCFVSIEPGIVGKGYLQLSMVRSRNKKKADFLRVIRKGVFVCDQVRYEVRLVNITGPAADLKFCLLKLYGFRRIKDQLDVTCYFISFLMYSTCFGQ